MIQINISDYVSSSNLRFLIDFFSGDYRPYDQDVFHQIVSCYDVSFIYNDIKNKNFYVGWAEWEYSDGEIHSPHDEEFSSYVNENNSCKITHNNFIKLAEQFMNMKKNHTSFAIIYRDDNDWIDCKGFDTQEEMEAFVQNNE